MTRKRFVKLLMSYGYQRNQANTYAVLARCSGSYKEYFCDNQAIFVIKRTWMSLARLGRKIAASFIIGLNIVKPVFSRLASFAESVQSNLKTTNFYNSDAWRKARALAGEQRGT